LQAAAEFQDHHLADRMMSIAESRSHRALGIACGSALRDLTGSAAVGLYLLDALEPGLVYSQHVPDDLLDNYRSGFWKYDPVLDTILTQGRTVDGRSLLGADEWSRSPSFKLLRHWGFTCNMGGPLRCESKIIGVLFTATRDAAYTALRRHHMEMLCRAASLALSNIGKAGQATFPRGENSSAIMLGDTPALLSMAALNEKLPPRSANVAIRVCRGQTNKQIAREMGISDQTVKEHVANLCKRFGTHNRTELAVSLLSGNVPRAL
jgi:DNA-binding CsgD family transcriptional regulator